MLLENCMHGPTQNRSAINSVCKISVKAKAIAHLLRTCTAALAEDWSLGFGTNIRLFQLKILAQRDLKLLSSMCASICHTLFKSVVSVN